MSIQKRRADLVEAASKPGQCSMSKYVRREVRREPSCSSLADDLAKIIDDSLAEDLSRQELSTAHGLSPGDNGLSESSTAMIVSASPGEKRDEEDLEEEQRAFPGEESEADEEEMEEESEADEESGDEENEEESGEEESDIWKQMWPPRQTARRISAEATTQGLALQQASLFRWQHLSQSVAHNLNRHSLPDSLTVGSICSGSGMDEKVCKATSEALAAVGHTLTLKHVFFSEISEKKQKWLMNTACSANPCVFGDCCELHTGAATCQSHGVPEGGFPKNSKEKPRKCNVKTTDCLFAGTSCKQLSRFNQQSSSSGRTTLLSDSRGQAPPAQAAGAAKNSSTDSYAATKAWIRKSKPSIVLLENSDGILDAQGAGDSQVQQCQSNVNVVQQDLQEEGYEVLAFICVSLDYGVCQKRRRFYVLGLKRNSLLWRIRKSSQFDKVFALFLDRMEEVKMKAPSLQEILLGEGNKHLSAELERRRKIPKDAPVRGARWIDDALDVCRVKRQRFHEAKRPCPIVAACPWFQCMSQREQGILAINHSVHGSEVAVDISQGCGTHDRVAQLPVHQLPTLLPNSSWFVNFKATEHSPAVTRSIIGLEALTMQAYPWQLLSDEQIAKGSDSLFSDLAGNSFTETVVGAILDAALQSIPWDPVEKAQQQERLDSALGAANAALNLGTRR